jgi:hypothetical protein
MRLCESNCPWRVAGDSGVNSMLQFWLEGRRQDEVLLEDEM